ncbi:MAG: HD-GYP domain-containing protein, partial [Dehalococcoidia bacterium]|nr:HD-GYP domain-containing protein [Dehalococcoidia bacterium]
RPHPVPGKKRRTLRSVIFNTSQFMIAEGVGGLVYYSYVPQVAPASLSGLENLLAIPMSALGVFMANSLMVSVMVGLHLKQNPIEIWFVGWRLDGVQFAGLFLIGVVAALASAQDAWVPLVMAVPAGLIYLSLKRTIELMEQTVSAVETMADVVDMRDHYTFEHSKRVADYAVQIARSMKLPAEDISAIRLAARVHDLGKIGVPDSILLKQSKLTQPEWEIMKKHPEVGHDILSRFPQYQRGKELVLTHHERFDGNGYPNGRDGQLLPLGSQIISVADALEAMISDRPYRNAMSLEQAMSEFRKYKGVQWNPMVVETLESLVTQKSLSTSPILRVAFSA